MMLVVSLAQSYESINHNPFTDALPNVPFQMREPFHATSIMYDREMMLWREVCKVYSMVVRCGTLWSTSWDD